MDGWMDGWMDITGLPSSVALKYTNNFLKWPTFPNDD